ncbi:hypothetical protein [Pontibacter virosus]|uniref:Uncharacterized protein n=1 Tax=Pontibacter virosus TaxID=1765052 RepID=A0A2U1B3C9_9BACT|nr:hypothetical protein [Pontibacter virosus]PVY43158.1 hypothetical protein C8E01_102335 [Pontibacter virosus]
MEHILKNELLYKEGDVEIYKTYNKEEDSYGLYWTSTDGYRRSEYQYTLIHPYEHQKAAALRLVGGIEWMWVWVDPDLNETKMDELSLLIWQDLRVSDSLCNCNSFEEMAECEMCVMGKIPNSYNFKKILDYETHVAYTYDTEQGYYTISLAISDEIHNMNFDYVWKKEELEDRLKGIIDTYEEQIFELESYLRVCVTESLEDSPTVRLTFFDVSFTVVKALDINSIAGPNNRTVLGFDDFPY